jgi:hypothetical protein
MLTVAAVLLLIGVVARIAEMIERQRHARRELSRLARLHTYGQ